jgi:hypothetical protein
MIIIQPNMILPIVWRQRNNFKPILTQSPHYFNQSFKSDWFGDEGIGTQAVGMQNISAAVRGCQNHDRDVL